MKIANIWLLFIPISNAFKILWTSDYELKKIATGKWNLIYSTEKKFPQYQVNLNIFPTGRMIAKHRFSKGPISLNRIYEGNYTLKKNTIKIEFEKPILNVVSFFGISFDQPIQIMSRQIPFYSVLKINYINSNEILLDSINSNKFCYLVRSTCLDDEPIVQVPFSTFIATHAAGLAVSYLFSYCLHLLTDFQMIF